MVTENLAAIYEQNLNFLLKTTGRNTNPQQLLFIAR